MLGATFVLMTQAFGQTGQWKVGAYAAGGQTKADVSNTEVNVIGHSFSSFGLEVKHQLGQLVIGTGVGTWSTHITEQTPHIRYVQEEQTVVVNTQDYCVTTIDLNGIVIKCRYINRDTVLQVNKEKTYYTDKKVALHYWQVPITLGYVFNREKLSVVPTLHVSANMRTGDAKGYKDQLWLGGAQLLINYQILPFLSAEIKASTFSTLHSPADMYQKWALFGGGIGCYYHF